MSNWSSHFGSPLRVHFDSILYPEQCGFSKIWLADWLINWHCFRSSEFRFKNIFSAKCCNPGFLIIFSIFKAMSSFCFVSLKLWYWYNVFRNTFVLKWSKQKHIIGNIDYIYRLGTCYSSFVQVVLLGQKTGIQIPYLQNTLPPKIGEPQKLGIPNYGVINFLVAVVLFPIIYIYMRTY